MVTVVTGGSRGIGAAAARHLGALGHAVVVNYRADERAARDVVAAIVAAGGQALAVRADVTREEDVAALFAAAAALGPVTGLVNNAGLTAHIGPLADTPVDVLRHVVDVNLIGALLCARAAVRVMSTARGGPGGAIVNVSSAAATLGAPGEYVHYAAAKAGIDALTVGLAKEVAAEGIRVNAVAPGTVRTRIHADAGAPGRADESGASTPLGRPGEPEDIAPAIAHLLGPGSAYTTGAVLRIAGGR